MHDGYFLTSLCPFYTHKHTRSHISLHLIDVLNSSFLYTHPSFHSYCFSLSGHFLRLHLLMRASCHHTLIYQSTWAEWHKFTHTHIDSHTRPPSLCHHIPVSIRIVCHPTALHPPLMCLASSHYGSHVIVFDSFSFSCQISFEH